MNKMIRKLQSDYLALWQEVPDLNGTSKRKKTLTCIGLYTIAFLAAFVIAYKPYLFEGTSFIWNPDGRLQHYPILVYVGRYLRRLGINILHGQFSLPLFDLSMGVGDDVIGFLNSIGGTDPLLLLSAFVPMRYSEYLYGFLAIFRVYLAGLSFLFLCCYFGKRPLYALIGSMVYCFSGYALYCSMRHPYFINPMILLPLLILGTEKVLKREKPYVLIFATCYSALNGYYHIYMMTIMIVLYALIRFFDHYKKDRLKEFVFAVGRGTFGYGLGFGMAAILFIPSVFNYLNASRYGFSNYNPPSYTWGYFLNRLLRLVAPSGSTGWTYTTCASITLFAVVLLFCSKRRRTIKILTVVVFATWLTGIGGLIMNGFQYSSNRWTFGFVLVLAFVVVEMLPDLLNSTKKQKLLCIAVLCVYAAIVFSKASTRKLTYVLVGVSFLAITLCVMTISLNERDMSQHLNRSDWKYTGIKYRAVVCLLLVIFNVGVNGIYFSSNDQGNYIRNC